MLNFLDRSARQSGRTYFWLSETKTHDILDAFDYLITSSAQKLEKLEEVKIGYKIACKKRKIVIFNIFIQNMWMDSYLEKFLWRKAKSLFVMDDFCTINEGFTINSH